MAMRSSAGSYGGDVDDVIGRSRFTPWRVGIAIAVTLFLLIGLIISGNLFQNVNADEVVCIQSPIAGDLVWYSTPGIKWQGLGTVTVYPKRSIYEFQTKVRFNDGGHADMKGSIQYEMPLDNEHLTAIHVRFGSAEAVQRQLVQTVVNKSVYMTGPIMSSKESYAEKRNQLIYFVEDQVENGVYQTKQREERTKDPLTNVERTVTVVEIALGKDGRPLRQEEAVLTGFGIRPFNFAITSLDYDQTVEAQITQQQQIVMDVQTAIAESKKAEQRALTAAKQGEATATEAKWKQEAEKAKAVVIAEQDKKVAELGAEKRLAVASLDAAAAEQYRLKKLREAEGDSTYKRQVMAADGALEQKLQALVLINERYAKALATYQGAWVPSVMMGGSGSSAATPAVDLITLLTAQAAKQLAVDLVPRAPVQGGGG